MDRTQIALIVLAVALMGGALTMGGLFPPAPQEDGSAPVPEASAPTSTTPRGAGSTPAPPQMEASPRVIPESSRAVDLTQAESATLQNDAVRLEVSAIGARLTSVNLLDFPDRIGEGASLVELVTEQTHGTGIVFLGDADFAAVEDQVHRLARHDARSATFILRHGDVEIERTWLLDETGYGARLRVALVNHGTATVRPRYQFAWFGRERPEGALDGFLNYQLVVSADGDLERVMTRGIHSSGILGSLTGSGAPTGESLPAPVDWIGIESQYFLLAAISEQPLESTAFQGPTGPDTGLVSLAYREFLVPAGTQVERTYRVYLGPKTPADVSVIDERLVPAVYVGWSWVRPFVDVFAFLLRWTYEHIVANYGVAIILLTILLRVCTFPLTQRSMKSMKKMGVIAPEMKEIQAKYKDDSQRMQSEMTALYKRTGVNPASAIGGGCLPMMLQMPFMLALYFALQGTIELRHAPFIFWIQDLSAPENLFSIAGLPIRVLPLLMGGSMLAQQWLTPATGDPQQRRMMMWMNVAFIFLFYRFPSGLVLYWFVSNLLGILQQLLVNRTPSADAPAKG